MNNTLQTIGISALVALVITAGAWALLPAKTPVVGAASFGNTSIDGSQSNLPSPSNYDYLVARLGLGLGTNLTNVISEAQKVSMVAATTTPCAIMNPTGATSTAEFNMNITTATSTTGTLTFATSTTAFATTSLITTVTVASGAQESFSTDGPAASANTIIGPNQWLVLGAAGDGAVGYTYGGSCEAIFTTLN